MYPSSAELSTTFFLLKEKICFWPFPKSCPLVNYRVNTDMQHIHTHMHKLTEKQSALKKKHLYVQTPGAPSRNKSQPKMSVKSKAGIRARAVHKRQSHDTAFQTAQLHRYKRHLPQQLQSKVPNSPQKNPTPKMLVSMALQIFTSTFLLACPFTL